MALSKAHLEVWHAQKTRDLTSIIMSANRSKSVDGWSSIRIITKDEASHGHQYTHVERCPCYTSKGRVVEIRQRLPAMSRMVLIWIVFSIVNVCGETERLFIELRGLQMRNREPRLLLGLYCSVCHIEKKKPQDQLETSRDQDARRILTAFTASYTTV
jgi:hypothetical protein